MRHFLLRRHGKESDIGKEADIRGNSEPRSSGKKNAGIRFWAVLAAVFLIFPYITSLIWSCSVSGLAGLEGREPFMQENSGAGWLGAGGRQEGNSGEAGLKAGERRICLGGGRKGYMSIEEYLPGLVAGQIPAEYEMEAIKAQAIIARTYIYRRMGDDREIAESRLFPADIAETETEGGLDREDFSEMYEKICRAVKETEGLVLMYEGKPVDPLFHRISAGATRTGDEAHPYLQPADSSYDMEAEGFLSVRDWEPAEFAERIGVLGGTGRISSDRVADSIQIVEKDDAGYVEQIQIGTHIYTGEQVRTALELPSAAFSVREHEGKIQTVCRGIGHGLGLSQYGADHMASEGKTAQEILEYYYKNVEIILPES